VSRQRVPEPLVDAFVEQNAHLGTREQELLRFFEGGDGEFAGDGGKSFQKLFEGFAAFEVVEERLDGDTGSAEDGSSAEDFGVFGDDAHGRIVARVFVVGAGGNERRVRSRPGRDRLFRLLPEIFDIAALRE